MRILNRTSLFECTRLFIFYLSAYALLTALAVSTPLLNKGAPFSSVISFIPFQLLYTATFLVPLALCTAVLTALGRMREDGELIALRSVGISAWSIIKGMLPLVIIIAVALSLLQHILLPDIAMEIRQGKSDLVRKGISTRINRGQAIWENASSGQQLMVQGTNGIDLHHLVAHNTGINRDIFVYAPKGIWRFKQDLHLECEAVRYVDIKHNSDGPIQEVITGTIPLSSQIIRSDSLSNRQLQKPDVKSFQQLGNDIQVLRKKLKQARHSGYSIHDRKHRHAQEALRSHQYAWHNRIAIPFSLCAYFLMAAGLGLSMPIKNRMLAIFIGTAVIIGNLLPGMLAVLGMGQYLRFNPAVLIWAPHTLTAIAGGFLIWRKR